MRLRSLGQEETLEEGTGTHSTILAQGIPWTEESGRLQSIGSQSCTLLSNVFMYWFLKFSMFILLKNYVMNHVIHEVICNFSNFF